MTGLDTLFPPLSAFRLPAAEDPAELAAFTYDVPTDTLFVDLLGHVVPAISVPVGVSDRDWLYARVDPDRRLIVGFQIEDFLSYAVGLVPSLLDALVFALFTGASPGDEVRLRTEAKDRRSKNSVVADLERLIA